MRIRDTRGYVRRYVETKGDEARRGGYVSSPGFSRGREAFENIGNVRRRINKAEGNTTGVIGMTDRMLLLQLRMIYFAYVTRVQSLRARHSRRKIRPENCGGIKLYALREIRLARHSSRPIRPRAYDRRIYDRPLPPPHSGNVLHVARTESRCCRSRCVSPELPLPSL